MATVSAETRGAVGLARLDRPEARNALSPELMEELATLCERWDEDPGVRCIVIAGGDDWFAAGADIKAMATRTFALIESMPQPVVAAINGQAWGGGCELSLACTLRVAAASAHLGQPEVAVGIIPGGGGTQRLPRLIGAGRAAQLILSARIIDAEEAERIGLVEAVLPDDGFLDAVLEWVAPIATKPRAAIVAAKRAVIEGLRLPLDDGLRLEGQLFIECQVRPDTVALQERVADAERATPADQRVDL